MFIKAEAEKQWESPPAGTHTAVLFSIIDLGTQKIEYLDDTKLEHRIRLDFELSEEKMSDGRPFAVSQEYKVSLHEKSKLYQLIKGWQNVDPHDGGGFDVASLLGKAANVTIVINEKGYAKITGVAPLKKSEKAPIPINPLRKFDLDNFKGAEFEAVPDFLKEKIKQSPEYIELSSGKKQEAKIPADVTEEIPF